MKTHIIKAFRVNEDTYKLYCEVQEHINIKECELRRLLFNRVLMELKVLAQDKGWENIEFSVKELN